MKTEHAKIWKELREMTSNSIDIVYNVVWSLILVGLWLEWNFANNYI